MSKIPLISKPELNLTWWPRYCNRIHVSQDASLSSPSPAPTQFDSTEEGSADPTPSIYHTLLSLYLTPPAPHDRNLAPALELLSKHGSRLPASSTLQLIPAELAVSELESYFRGRIRAANSVVNESRIEKWLRQNALVDTEALLCLGDGIPGGQGGKSRRVVINDERLCGVCNKRLGGSVIAVLADNTVVHYGCLNKAGRPEASRAASWGRRSGI